MIGGHSGCSGMILYDTERKDDFNAVYGYYDKNGNIILEKGMLDELKDRKKEQEKPFKRENSPGRKILVGLFLAMVISVLGSFFLFPIVISLGLLAFCTISYMPLLVIIFANINGYKDDETKMQFRRYHGCEHAIINYHSRGKNKDWSVESLKATPIFHRECGTAYSGYVLFLAVVVALLIFNIASLGFFKALGILVLVLILLFLNLFNPANPFLLIQRAAIAQPTEREYILGIAVADALWDIETKKNTEEDHERE